MNGDNSLEFWDRYAREHWERKQGREQTRLFALYFLEVVDLPLRSGSLLDMGCAMGDAVVEFHQRCPNLAYTGMDPVPYFIEKAREAYGSIASFKIGGFDDLAETYDIIYCSNTLEHFSNYLEIAQKLLSHCRWLYVMGPYKEMRHGRHLSLQNPADQHVVTFTKQSFSELLPDPCAAKRHWIRRTPIAWDDGPAPVRRAVALRRSLRYLLFDTAPRQIILELCARQQPTKEA